MAQYSATNRKFTALDRFKFSDRNGNNDFNGEVYNAQVFDIALTDEEIIKLTTI